MQSDEIRMIVKEAVHETLSGLGVSASEPLEVQADFIYIRKMRKGSEFMARRVKGSVIAVVVPSFLYLLWEAVKTSLSKGA